MLHAAESFLTPNNKTAGFHRSAKINWKKVLSGLNCDFFFFKSKFGLVTCVDWDISTWWEWTLYELLQTPLHVCIFPLIAEKVAAFTSWMIVMKKKKTCRVNKSDSRCQAQYCENTVPGALFSFFLSCCFTKRRGGEANWPRGNYG